MEVERRIQNFRSERLKMVLFKLTNAPEESLTTLLQE